MGATADIIYDYSSVPVLIERSKRMVKSLMERFLLHPNKSKTIEFPKVPKNLLPSMLRGNFDVDGHFSIREAGFVTASESFALSFYETLQEWRLNPLLNLEKPKDTWLFRIYFRGKNHLRKLEKILYSDGSSLYKTNKRERLLGAYCK